MRVELIGGNAKVITIMLRDGWKIINTFPNPYPEPYFFALMEIDHEKEDEYDIESVEDIVFRNKLDFPKWNLSENIIKRKEYYNSVVNGF
jgi:hypothetical protein